MLLLLVPSSLRSQVGSADVLGTVTDPSGAVVQNAKVAIINLDTSATRTATTSARGEYIFSLMPNGRYSIKVESTGFKTYEVKKFALSTGDRLRMDATLETGTVTEKVEVTATAAALQTDSSTVGSTVEEKQVQDLPLNGRNYVDSILLQPGINAGFGTEQSGTGSSASLGSGTPSDRRPSSIIIANGQPDSLNNNLIDGFDNNERSMGVIDVRPSLDGISEMKVDTENYRPEYGRTAGGVIDVITKAGTNDFHGSVYEYFRNDIFDAAGFLYPTKPELRQNQFGGSIGGPIKKGKTFFFADIEEDRLVQGVANENTVPTALERATPGDFTDLFPSVHAGPPTCGTSGGPPMGTPPCIPLIIPPGQLNSIALEYFNLYPMPTNSKFASNYVGNTTNTQYITTVDGRIDHRFTSNDLLFARYAYNPSASENPGAFPQDKTTGIWPIGASGSSDTTSQNVQIDYVHIFSPALLMDLKAGYARINVAATPMNYGKGVNAADKLDIPNVYVPGIRGSDTLAAMDTATWADLGDGIQTPYFNKSNTYQYSGALNYTWKTHSFKAGSGIVRRQSNIFQDSVGGGGFYLFAAAPPYFDDRPNFLAGDALGLVRQNQLDNPLFESWEWSVYAQDDWRVNAKLTLNLGVRYDIFTPITEAHNQYANYDPSTIAAGNLGAQNFILGSQSATIGVKTDYADVAPRIGFAYSITPKTVLRGGFGTSYFPADVGASTQARPPVGILQNQNIPYVFTYANIGAGVSLSTPMVVPSVIDLNSYVTNANVTSVSVKAKNLRSSYVEQMNLFLQREIGANTITLGYVGVIGNDLLRTNNLEQPEAPGAGNPAPPYVYAGLLPNMTTMLHNYNGNVSNYSAMQLIATRRFTKGLSLNANYTWSHGLADGLGMTDTDNSHVDYGNSNYDIRHRVAVSGNYELPIGMGATGIRAVAIKAWQVNGAFHWQTGLYQTITSEAGQLPAADAPPGPTNLYINIPGLSDERPDQIAKTKLSHPTANEWFNVDAFSPQTVGTIGSERANQVVGPTDRRLDLSLMKHFDLVEGFKLQFRAECFNVANIVNYGRPNGTSTAWNYGVTPIVPAIAASGSVFGSITSWASGENPRQFQFALKLLF
jgi:hypothetical protein